MAKFFLKSTVIMCVFGEQFTWASKRWFKLESDAIHIAKAYLGHAKTPIFAETSMH